MLACPRDGQLMVSECFIVVQTKNYYLDSKSLFDFHKNKLLPKAVKVSMQMTYLTTEEYYHGEAVVEGLAHWGGEP